MTKRNAYIVLVDQWASNKPQRLVYGCHSNYDKARKHTDIIEQERIRQGMTPGALACMTRHDIKREIKNFNQTTAYRHIMNHADDDNYDCVAIEVWRVH